MHKLLVGKAGPIVLGFLFVMGHPQIAKAKTYAQELPPPSTWRTMAGALSKLTQTKWASAVSAGHATAAKCQWRRQSYHCFGIKWRIGQSNFTAATISWHANQTGGPLNIDDGQWQNTFFKRYTPSQIDRVRHKHGNVMIHIDVLKLTSTIQLGRIRWEKKQRRVAIANSATEQGNQWSIINMTRFDIWPNQHRDKLSTKNPIQHLNGWLAPQVLWSQGAGVEFQGMYAWPVWDIGVGATINPGHYYMLTGALFSQSPETDTVPLKISMGVGQDGAFTYSALGQWRLGNAYQHLDVDAQWTKQSTQGATGRLTTNQVLSPFERTRAGLSASGNQATTQLALFDDAQAQEAARGVSLVFGTHRSLSKRTSLRLNVWHLGTFEHGEQPTINQSDVQFGLNWQFGDLDRMYLRAQASSWMLLQVEKVLQGWSATSVGRLTAQVEAGIALTGYFDGVRHDVTPKLIIFEQPLVRVKRDNRIAQPIPIGASQTWGVYQLQLAQSFHLGKHHHIELPVSVAWLRAREDQWLGMARVRYINDQRHGIIEMNIMRYASKTGWQLQMESPPLGGLRLGYGVGQMSSDQMSLVSLLQINNMSLQAMRLQRSFDVALEEEEDRPLVHNGRLSWEGDAHAVTAHGAFAAQDWWSGALTHQYRLRAIGWAVQTTGFVFNDKTQTQLGLGFGMMQRFE